MYTNKTCLYFSLLQCTVTEEAVSIGERRMEWCHACETSKFIGKKFQLKKKPNDLLLTFY